MSGRAKRILYYVLTATAGLAAVACAFLMAFMTVREWAKLPVSYLAVFCVAAGALFVLRPSVIVHEFGHLLFGACAKMKCVSFSVGFVNFTRGKGVSFGLSASAGETQMLPRGTKNLRRRMMAATLGGAVLNFIVGAVFVTLFFTLPRTPALLFFELLAPFQLHEGLAALLPAELNTGRTDGALFSELKRKTSDGEVFLRVLNAQGILEEGDFSEIPQELLFDVPVVREDSLAFLSLLHLRFQYLLYRGDAEGASRQIFRLEELSEYLPVAVRAQIACDAAFTRYILNGKADFDLPEEAKKTTAYYRIAAVKNEETQFLKKNIQRERSRGIRTLEEMLLSQYIENK